MPGITIRGIRYPDGATKAVNLGPELKTMAEDLDSYVYGHAVPGAKGDTGKTGADGLAGPASVETSTAIASWLDGDAANPLKSALARHYVGVYTPQMFAPGGVVSPTNATAACQAAIDAALASSDPADWMTGQPYNAHPPTVYLPKMAYVVDTLYINGTINMIGDGSYLYASSQLKQRTPGQCILILGADTDGQSNASTFEKLTFRSTSGTSNPDVAQIKTVAGIVSNSVYFRWCWFSSPETYAIWMTQGGDIQITGCTFDVAAFGSIRLGQGSRHVENCRITNNTFYDISTNVVKVENVKGLIVSGNSAYGPGGHGNSVFLNTEGCYAARDVVVTGNRVANSARFLALSTTGQGLTATGNALMDVKDSLVSLSGGGVFYSLVFTGNTYGDTLGTAFASGAAFSGPGCGLSASVVAHNSIIPGATTARMFNLSDARVSGNVCNANPQLRFTANNNFANAAANGA